MAREDEVSDTESHHTTAAAGKRGILATGDAFGRSAEFGELVQRLGVGFWPTYFAGRAGVMGDVGAETVAATLGFFSPNHVATSMRESVPAGTLSELAAEDTAALDRWGRRVFAGLGSAERTLELTQRVVAAADPSALPLFAAWRSAAATDSDARALLARSLMCRREHRGGVYLIAVRSVGLTPLEAALAQGGEEKAVANGWTPPFDRQSFDTQSFETASDATGRWARAEEFTAGIEAVERHIEDT